jgi:hypothetical protein
MDELRTLVGQWKAGRDGREVALAASDALDDVCARLERVRQRCPGAKVSLGEDVHALLKLRNRHRGHPPMSGGLRRAASLL